MLLRSILYVGLTATAVSAAPMSASNQRRDLPTVQKAFDNVGIAIDKLTEAVNSFSGDLEKLPVLLETSQAIAKMNAEGAELVKKSPTMGITDALAIITPTMAIQEKVDKVMAAFLAKKEPLEAAGARDIVLEQMYEQRKSADLLAAAILGNLPMPGLLGPIATPIAATITNSLNNGITAWGGTPPPAPGKSSTPSSSTSSAPKAPKAPKGKGKGGPSRYQVDIEDLI